MQIELLIVWQSIYSLVFLVLSKKLQQKKVRFVLKDTHTHTDLPTRWDSCIYKCARTLLSIA